MAVSVNDTAAILHGHRVVQLIVAWPRVGVDAPCAVDQQSVMENVVDEASYVSLDD